MDEGDVVEKHSTTAKPLGCSTLLLVTDSRKSDAKTPFVCDGRACGHSFQPEQDIALVGLGFAGPIDEDAFYDVTVDIGSVFPRKSFLGGGIMTRIYAKKNETFYFIFDEPITVKAIPLDASIPYKYLQHSLTGPNTSSIVAEQHGWTKLEEGSNRFSWRFQSNQLSEILFQRL